VVQVGVGDEISLYMLPQDLTDGKVEYARVHGPLDTGVEGAGVQAYIIAAAFGSHHVCGKVTFIEAAFYTQRDDGESWRLREEGKREQRQQQT